MSNSIIYPYNVIIFDLDGTLLNTEIGVIESVEFTIRALGFEELSYSELRKFIGPPIQESFRSRYSLDDVLTIKATEVFRDRYKNQGIYQASEYVGMKNTLIKLHELGFLLAVATFKRQDYAIKMLEHFGYKDYFVCIFGSEEGKNLSKQDIVQNCIEFINRPTVTDHLLIGDSLYDSVGANAAGIDFLGVTYGFGFQTKTEVLEAGAVFVAETPLDISDFLLNP